MVGKGIDRLQVEITERTVHRTATAHPGHLLRVDPAIGGRRCTQAHGLERRLGLGKTRLDTRTVVQLHQQAFSSGSG